MSALRWGRNNEPAVDYGGPDPSHGGDHTKEQKMTSSKTKRATAPKAEEPARQDIPSNTAAPDEEAKRTVTRLITSPELAASRAIVATEATTAVGEHVDLLALLGQLRDDAAAVNRGDLSQAEAMLMNQATALQTLFARLVGSSMNADFLPQQKTAMRLALKAQRQCRATLETLAAIKNPPIVCARQASLTTGPQQVNNGTAAPLQARELETEPTELSGASHEPLPNARTSSSGSRVDPAVETLGQVDRVKCEEGKARATMRGLKGGRRPFL